MSRAYIRRHGSLLDLVRYFPTFFVGTNLGPTHERAASNDTDAAPMLRAVRQVRGAGQTGRRGESAKSDERSPGRDPVRACTRRVVLGSSDHLERIQTSRRRRKNSRKWLKGLGFGDKSKGNKYKEKVMY